MGFLSGALLVPRMLLGRDTPYRSFLWGGVLRQGCLEVFLTSCGLSLSSLPLSFRCASCASQHPTDVDYRVMATFTEFYTTLLGFVNFRLYQSLSLHYPPKVGPSPVPPHCAGVTALLSPRGGRGCGHPLPLTFLCLPARGSGPHGGGGPRRQLCVGL